MSTKIYNGYKLPRLTFKQALKFCQNLRPLFEEQKRKQYANLLVTKRLESLDQFVAYGIKKKSYIEIDKEIRDEISEAMTYRNSEADMSCSVILIPCQSYCLALLFAENDEMIKIWKKQKRVKDYHYQNSTDRPEKITAKEWNKRKSDWDKFLVDSIPSRSGLSFQFTHTDRPFLSKLDLEKYYNEVKPSLEKRAKRLALDVTLGHWFKNLATEDQKLAFGSAMSWARDDEAGQKMNAEKTQEFLSTLVEYETVEALFTEDNKQD